MAKKKKGTLFVISGPSGCGKTTLCEQLHRRRLGLVRSVSVTTRSPRKGEQKGRDYIYVTEEKFKEMIRAKAFLEYATVFDKHYGTPKKLVKDALNNKKDVILSIDIQGAIQVKRVLSNAVLIFIMTPSFDELKGRLKKRSSETTGQRRKRLKIAHHELQAMGAYDYLVINDKMKQAVDDLSAIINNTRKKSQ